VKAHIRRKENIKKGLFAMGFLFVSQNRFMMELLKDKIEGLSVPDI
jgi:hypothetical protein